MKIRNVKRIKVQLKNGRRMKMTYRRAYELALQKPDYFTVLGVIGEGKGEQK